MTSERHHHKPDETERIDPSRANATDHGGRLLACKVFFLSRAGSIEPTQSKSLGPGGLETNELEGAPAASPSRTAGPTRRTKKQTSKQSKETKSTSAESREKQTNNGATTVTPPVEIKHVTPLPGFQQAFGSTEIGKFSEPWEAHGAAPPVDAYDSTPGTSGYGLPISASHFHPSYYESSSYSDHAVDSPLGNYFSEMTCNEFVN
uniref:Uncharacterized protein n=1 Tax=Anopheles coluzzii TaxID=1518534 RepID=A0A8W7PYH6_ANOCL